MEPNRDPKIRALVFATTLLARELRLPRDPSAAEPATPEEWNDLRSLVDELRKLLESAPEGAADSGRSAERSNGRKDHAHAGPSRDHAFALTGKCNRIPLSDVTSFLAGMRCTGILEIETSRETMRIHFRGGSITHGESDHAPGGQRLGDLLVVLGAIDRSLLEHVLEERSGEPLGQRLLRLKLIDEKQLASALRLQIQGMVNRTFRHESTEFTFWSGPAQRPECGVCLNVTSLLLEAARESDESDADLRSSLWGPRAPAAAPERKEREAGARPEEPRAPQPRGSKPRPAETTVRGMLSAIEDELADIQWLDRDGSAPSDPAKRADAS